MLLFISIYSEILSSNLDLETLLTSLYCKHNFSSLIYPINTSAEETEERRI